MSDDASLDDFIGESADGDDAASGDADAADGAEGETPDPADTETASAPDSEPVDPVVSTYDWSPGGVPCGACGDVVRARWRDDGDLVCTDCKEW